MTCWHIQRPMTPVPTQPTRVLPGSTFATAMTVPYRKRSEGVTNHPYARDAVGRRPTAAALAVRRWAELQSSQVFALSRGDHDRSEAAFADRAGPRPVRLRPDPGRRLDTEPVLPRHPGALRRGRQPRAGPAAQSDVRHRRPRPSAQGIPGPRSARRAGPLDRP